MAFGLHAIPDFLDLAVRPDEEGTARNAHEGSAQEFLHSPSSVGFDRFVFRVAQQREIELLLRFEAGEGFFRVAARTEDNHSELVELLLRVTKLGRFDRSTRCVSFGKEKEKHVLAAEIR
jgi:hypothetical protein